MCGGQGSIDLPCYSWCSHGGVVAELGFAVRRLLHHEDLTHAPITLPIDHKVSLFHTIFSQNSHNHKHPPPLLQRKTRKQQPQHTSKQMDYYTTPHHLRNSQLRSIVCRVSRTIDIKRLITCPHRYTVLLSRSHRSKYTFQVCPFSAYSVCSLQAFDTQVRIGLFVRVTRPPGRIKISLLQMLPCIDPSHVRLGNLSYFTADSFDFKHDTSSLTCTEVGL